MFSGSDPLGKHHLLFIACLACSISYNHTNIFSNLLLASLAGYIKIVLSWGVKPQTPLVSLRSGLRLSGVPIMAEQHSKKINFCLDMLTVDSVRERSEKTGVWGRIPQEVR